MLDLAQQGLRGIRQGSGHLALLRVEPAVFEQAGQADDRGQRRAQFMADARQEQGFCAAGALGLRPRHGDIAQQDRAIGRQHRERQQQADGEGRMAAPERRGRDDETEAGQHQRDGKTQKPRAEPRAGPQDHPPVERKQPGRRAAALDHGGRDGQPVHRQGERQTDAADRRTQGHVDHERRGAEQIGQQDRQARAQEDARLLALGLRREGGDQGDAGQGHPVAHHLPLFRRPRLEARQRRRQPFQHAHPRVTPAV